MGTHAQIAFYENNFDQLSDWAYLIRMQMDGYPEQVLPDLIPFLLNFSSKYWDPDDLTAYCLAEMIHVWAIGAERRFMWGKRRDETGLITLNRGIMRDIDYLYIIYPKCLKILEITAHGDGKDFCIGGNEEEEDEEEEASEDKHLPAGVIILDIDFTSRESVIAGLANLIGTRKTRWQGQDYSQVISKLTDLLQIYAQNSEALSKEF